MSLIPYQGQRPSSTHPDAFRTAQSLGRLARQLYDNWYSRGSSSSSSTLSMSGKSSRSGKSRRVRSSGMTPVSQADLAVRPPSTRIPTSVPRNVSSRVVWDIVKIDTTITPSSSGLTETNFTAALQLHPQVSSWSALFDQWCIPQFSVTFRSLSAPGNDSGPVAVLYTALDFDSSGALGTVAKIEDFATCDVDNMTTGAVVTRSIRPCVKLSTQQTSTNVNATLARPWQDTGAAGTPWFCIRSICSAVDPSDVILATLCIWFAFRNQI
jgi:hypothetical protein